MQMDDVIYCIC